MEVPVLRLDFKRRQLNRQREVSQSAQKGLTLLECLVAIVVIAFSAAAVAPAMILTVATRVQSQKADQALRLAQEEVDQVRLQMERGTADFNTLPSSVTTTDVRTISAPTAFVAGPATESQARLVDIDGDGNNDFAIQSYRDEGVVPTGETNPIAFSMGVRVYDISAEEALGSLGIEPAALGLTSGQGQRSSRPLAALYTEVLRGDANDSYCEYAGAISTTSTGLDCN
jgi:prepilin-type N-terminal cleavage/methylation domain-containing protein